MIDSVRLLSKAALDAVQDIPEPYQGYHAELVDTFAKVLWILHTEPNHRAELRAIESLIESFAAEVSSKLGELQ